MSRNDVTLGILDSRQNNKNQQEFWVNSNFRQAQTRKIKTFSFWVQFTVCKPQIEKLTPLLLLQLWELTLSAYCSVANKMMYAWLNLCLLFFEHFEVNYPKSSPFKNKEILLFPTESVSTAITAIWYNNVPTVLQFLQSFYYFFEVFIVSFLLLHISLAASNCLNCASSTSALWKWCL